MKRLKKILVPTDFSDGATAAYRYAQKIASISGGTVDLIHVIPMLEYFNRSLDNLGLPLDMEKEVYPRVIEESEAKMQSAMDDYLEEVNQGQFFVKVDRKSSKVICSHAKDHSYDLIVMGAKGSHHTEMMQGTTAEKVIRHSKVPVLVVPRDLSISEVKKILVPSDLSDVSLSSLPIAASMSKYLEGEITLFHVLELYGTLSESIPREMGESEEQAIYRRLIDKAKSYITDQLDDTCEFEKGTEPFLDYLIIRGESHMERIPIRTKIVKGVNAHHEIEGYADEYADLIVMATHGHTGLAHFFLGSTTEQVAQRVKMPTLTIRPEAKMLKERE